MQAGIGLALRNKLNGELNKFLNRVENVMFRIFLSLKSLG